MKCLLSVNVKDEHNLGEWIHYHLLLGFDFILIWDDGSQPPVQTSHEKVVVIPQHSKKIDYMTDSVAFAKRHGYDWILHLDADEYLYLGVNVRLDDFMKSYGGHDKMAILFPWVLFGSNQINVLEPKGSCLRPFVKCATKTHKYIKPLARVSMITGVRSPHEFLYSQPYTPQNTVLAPSKTLRNFSVVQTREIQPISPNRCFIAHYRFQSWDLFCQRKGRIRDDTQKAWKFPFSLGKEPPAFFHIDSNHVYFPHVLENFLRWSEEK
jgi:hypothetical protein